MAIIKNIDPLDAVLGDDRQLQDVELKLDFLPYVSANLEATVLDCHPKLYKDQEGRQCSGVFATVRVEQSDVPEVAQGKLYALCFFVANPKLHAVILQRHFIERAQFAAAVEGVPFSAGFEVATALRKFHNATSDLNVRIAIKRTSKMSAKGKPFTETEFRSLAQ